MLAKTFETNESCLHYLISSQTKDETLLFLHPEFTDSYVFANQFDAFGDEYRILAVDMPGHGKSFAKHKDTTLVDYPNQLRRLLESEGIRHVHIIGVSMGAIMAQSLAHRYPRLVRSLSCVGGFSIHHGYPGNQRIWHVDPLRRFNLLFNFPRFKEIVSDEAAISPMGRRVFKEGTNTFDRTMFSWTQDLRPLFNSSQAPPNVPLLVLCGAEDSPIVRESSMRLSDNAPHCTVADIPDAGHVANLDQPKIFNRLLRMFLDDIHR